LLAADAAVGAPACRTPGGLMSSAILYIAIVAIWAFVLIPRWLRRPHLLGGETAEPEIVLSADLAAEPLAGQPTAEFSEAESAAEAGLPSPAARTSLRAGRAAAVPPTRTRVLQARRRLLTMLFTLAAAAGVCTYMKLISWWVCVPPAGMLGIYLLLLREAALADAEQARWRAADSWRAQAARRVALVEQTAEVIDISVRLSDQLYDQYADATIRAVGD
jgi:hypothetical protein